jgi:hypothetical protein
LVWIIKQNKREDIQDKDPFEIFTTSYKAQKDNGLFTTPILFHTEETHASIHQTLTIKSPIGGWNKKIL